MSDLSPTRPHDHPRFKPLAFARRLLRMLLRPQMLSFLPALVLAAYWYGGEGVLTLFAVTFPMVMLVAGLFERGPSTGPVDPETGLPQREALIDALDDTISETHGQGSSAFAVALELDDAQELVESLGQSGMERVLHSCGERIGHAVRSGDTVARIGPFRFGVLIWPMRGTTLDVAITATERMQAAISEPISVDGSTVHVTASAGICLARRAPELLGDAILASAETALEEAARGGPGSMRTFSVGMQRPPAIRKGLSSELARAFDHSEIRAWFQPQVSTDTGEVTGFETLARWHHPERGLLLPGEFLLTIEAEGQMHRLGQVMMTNGLRALRDWERAGFRVPHVSLNLTSAELRNPRLVDHICWELDRFDLTPDRLAIEVLETVVARTDDDSLTRTLAALARLGCLIDLDDFGTGQASIGNIRRFSIQRIKIDRSFVTRVDEDQGQQQMVAAILSLANQLELDTVAEGVETTGEHSILAQLGCGHVQGYGVARPMPVEDTLDWLRRHQEKLSHTPKFAGKAG